jgi:hypothetical protein
MTLRIAGTRICGLQAIFMVARGNPVKEHARAREGDGSEGKVQGDLKR